MCRWSCRKNHPHIIHSEGDKAKQEDETRQNASKTRLHIVLRSFVPPAFRHSTSFTSQRSTPVVTGSRTPCVNPCCLLRFWKKTSTSQAVSFVFHVGPDKTLHRNPQTVKDPCPALGPLGLSSVTTSLPDCPEQKSRAQRTGEPVTTGMKQPPQDQRNLPPRRRRPFATQSTDITNPSSSSPTQRTLDRQSPESPKLRRTFR